MPTATASKNSFARDQDPPLGVERSRTNIAIAPCHDLIHNKKRFRRSSMKKCQFLGLSHEIFYQLSIYAEDINKGAANLAEHTQFNPFRTGDKTVVLNQTRAVIHCHPLSYG
jgi:hypothetical protein